MIMRFWKRITKRNRSKIFEIGIFDRPKILKRWKAPHALTRLANTYNIPIHKLTGNDATVPQLDYNEMMEIAETYKNERNRPRISK